MNVEYNVNLCTSLNYSLKLYVNNKTLKRKLCYNLTNKRRWERKLTLALNQENKGSLSPSIKYINIIHENSDGWVTKAKISDKGHKQWHYKYKDLIELKFDEDNIYHSKYLL